MAIHVFTRSYRWWVLEIKTNLAQGEAPIMYRTEKEGEFQCSPFTVANARYDGRKAFKLVSDWLKGQ
jgi:hypothetical protein